MSLVNVMPGSDKEISKQPQRIIFPLKDDEPSKPKTKRTAQDPVIPALTSNQNLGYTDPNGEHGAWKSGEVGAKIGEILSEIFQSYQEWKHGQDDFVKDLLGQIGDMDEVKNNRLNVGIFAHDEAEYFFTNYYSYYTDDTAWWGILDKQYHIVIFESGWFVRSGKGGFSNWGFSYYSGYGAGNSGGERLAIVYAGQRHNPTPPSPQDIIDADQNSGHDITQIWNKVLENASTSGQDTAWLSSRWGTKAYSTGTGYPCW